LPRYNLKTLLVSVFLAGLPLCWVGERADQSHRQWLAVRHVESSGAMIQRETSILPDWLLQLAGYRFADSAEGVWVFRQEFNDEDLAGVLPLSGVRELGLAGTSVRGTTFSDLDRLPKLALVDASRTQITNQAVVSLSSCMRIEQLYLSHTPIDDRGLEGLPALANLRIINLSRTGVSDGGLRHLSTLAELEMLDLSATRVKGPGLFHLSGLPRLRSLLLQGTAVSDEHVVVLEGLQSLRQLDLRDTKVSNHAVSRLRKSLPRCMVHFQPLDDRVCL
jgi:hypothetical protein